VVAVLTCGGIALIGLLRLRTGTKYATEAFGIYSLQRADLASRLIHLDEGTRTWPALLTEEGIHQLETGRVMLLNMGRDADASAEWASLLIRAAGIAERGAKRIGATRGDPAALDALGATVSSIPQDPGGDRERTPLPSPTFSPLLCQECDKETEELKATKSPNGDTRACPDCRAELLQQSQSGEMQGESSHGHSGNLGS
jgi:hypothetical protein